MRWMLTLCALLLFASAALAADLPNPFYAMDTVANLGNEPLEQKLDDLKTMGYAGLSWTGTDIPQIQKVIQAAETRGMKVYALYVPFNLSKDRLDVPANFDALCETLAGHDTIVWIYILSKDYRPSDPGADAIAVPTLRNAAQRASKHNVKLALYPHFGFWAQGFPDCLRIAKAVDRPNFGVSFNLCHVLKTGDEANVISLLQASRPYLFMVSLNGADAGLGPKGNWDRLIQPIGKGSYDLTPILKQLRFQGYTGPIGFQGYGIQGDRKEILRQTMEGWKKITASLAVVPLSGQLVEVGTAAVKITPPVGIGMAGYYFERGAQGTNDDLFAKAIVMKQGDTAVALVGLDLISTTREMVEQARSIVEKETGIPGANVMISATHAHTGPVLAHRGAREDVLGGSSDLAVQYAQTLPGLIAESVKLAASQTVPATISAGIGRAENLSFNRRYFMQDGTVGWNPGKLNPKIVKPAGPIDPDVGVVLFEAMAKRGPQQPIATYVNFAMHPDTVGGELFSADYPGALSRILTSIMGERMITLFANGCCGNINHVDVKWSAPQRGIPEATRIATILAAEVLQTCKRLETISNPSIRVRSVMVSLPLPAVTTEQVERSRKVIAELGMKDNRGFMDKVVAYKILDVAARQGRSIDVEVQVVALGDDLAFVSMPGEIFTELGLAIKGASPFRYTLIAELANGSIGYIPDRKGFSEGNYEPVSARCAEGSGEMLVEAALKLLNEIKR